MRRRTRTISASHPLPADLGHRMQIAAKGRIPGNTPNLRDCSGLRTKSGSGGRADRKQWSNTTKLYYYTTDPLSYGTAVFSSQLPPRSQSHSRASTRPSSRTVFSQHSSTKRL